MNLIQLVGTIITVFGGVEIFENKKIDRKIMNRVLVGVAIIAIGGLIKYSGAN